MFLNKKLILFSLFLIFSYFIFAANPPVNTLELEFSRKELLSDSKSEIKGSIYYQLYPYVFVLEINFPEKQITYQNSEGSYSVGKNELYDFSQGNDYLTQTCLDFNNWFKTDFGIAESGYRIAELEKVENQVCITLYFYKQEETAIAMVKMFRNTDGNHTKLCMYDGEKTLVAETSLSEYKRYNSFVYPGKIETKTYSKGNLISNVELCLYNAQINFLKESEYSSNLFVPAETEIYTVQQNKSTAEKPSQKKYSVSSSAVFVNCAYSFYKAFITDQDIPGCAFNPTCSSYMMQAVSAHGLPGVIEGLDRLKRCTKTEVKRNIYKRNENGKIIEVVE